MGGDHNFTMLVAPKGLDGPDVTITCQCGWHKRAVSSSKALAAHEVHSFLMRHPTLASMLAVMGFDGALT
jgi:hypothetical protein